MPWMVVVSDKETYRLHDMNGDPFVHHRFLDEKGHGTEREAISTACKHALRHASRISAGECKNVKRNKKIVGQQFITGGGTEMAYYAEYHKNP